MPASAAAAAAAGSSTAAPAGQLPPAGYSGGSSDEQLARTLAGIGTGQETDADFARRLQQQEDARFDPAPVTAQPIQPKRKGFFEKLFFGTGKR